MNNPTLKARTVTLTEENYAALSFFTDLTGFSHEELVNSLLADELTCFSPQNDDEYPLNVLGCLKYKDRASAERTLGWAREKVLPAKLRSNIRTLPEGRFEINAFRHGERLM